MCEAVQFLVPERMPQYLGQVYEYADKPGTWPGPSLEFAYLLALVRCSRSFRLEASADLGDVWCTGGIAFEGTPRLRTEELELTAKLDGFLEQAHKCDRLFFVPSSSLNQSHYDKCLARRVDFFSLEQFRPVLTKALKDGRSPAPAVIHVRPNELQELVKMLFESPRPYKFLEAFGPADAALFCGRDEDIARLQQMITTSRLLILSGASGTGKTSLLQAGLFHRLSAERYAWFVVRMVDDEPTTAIKMALVRECGVDVQSQSLLEGVNAAIQGLRREVVLILDQFEEFFQHKLVPCQRLYEQLRACIGPVHLDLHVVIVLREDYLAQLLDEFHQTDGAIPIIFLHRLLEEQQSQGTILVTRLARFTRHQAYEAIVNPAKRLRLRIKEDFVEPILLSQLTNADGTIELPVLQIVCNAWYQQATVATLDNTAEAILDEAAYAALDGIPTVLAGYLDQTLREFRPEEAKQAWEVLKALVRTPNTQRAVFPDTLLRRLRNTAGPRTEEELRRVLQQLVRVRLVRAIEGQDQMRYELIHAYLEESIKDRIKVKEQTLIRQLWSVTRFSLGVSLVLAFGVLALWFFQPQEKSQVTVAMSYSDEKEVSGISTLGHELASKLKAEIVLQFQGSALVRALEEMDATESTMWDLIIVDNDTLGIIAKKGLVRDLSKFPSSEKLIPDTLLSPFKEEFRDGEPFYFVPFRTNVKLLYYNENMLQQVEYTQPGKTWEGPKTWQELSDLI
jgi:hypothetical protein